MKNKDYIKLWSNDKKRREFIKGYKKYGEHRQGIDELELDFYKIDLPNGNAIWALEHMAKVYDYEAHDYKFDRRTKYYYQDGVYFEPSAVSDSFIGDKLKTLKMEIQEGKWNDEY